jgi:Ca-activated chloride channel family protein
MASRLPLRPLLLSLSLGSLWLSSGTGRAQSADDYYHNGAQFYIFGENAKAKEEVETGQRRYPNDPKLNELAALLKQPEQPPPSGKGEDKKDKDKDKDKDKEQKQKQEQQKQEKEQKEKEQKEKQDKESQQQQGQPDKEQKEKKDEAQKQGQQAKPSDQGEDPEGAPQSAAMMRMTPQQAMQLLEALKGEEKVMTFRPVLKTNRHDRVFKDW